MTNFWQVEDTFFAVCFQSMAANGGSLIVFESVAELYAAIEGMKQLEAENGWARK